jgi:hypothetical protein
MMKIKGVVNCINKEDNTWIFKFTEDGVVKRIPFVYYSGVYEDGQEIEAYLETLAGIERAKPLFPLPFAVKPTEEPILTNQPSSERVEVKESTETKVKSKNIESSHKSDK